MPFRFASRHEMRLMSLAALTARYRQMRDYLKAAAGDFRPLTLEGSGNGIVVGE